MCIRLYEGESGIYILTHTYTYTYTSTYTKFRPQNIGLLADACSRWNTLKGLNTHLMSGTDEHGQKVKDACIAAADTATDTDTGAATSMTQPISDPDPEHDIQTFSDSQSLLFKSMFDKYGVEYNIWQRTTTKQHQQSVYMLWNLLMEKGYIYLGEHQGTHTHTHVPT